MRSYRNILCTNCGIKGHILKGCNEPITSFGIIAYKYIYNEIDDQPENEELKKILVNTECENTLSFPKIKLLMIQRKDTIGYTDFVRGKYPSYNSLKAYFTEMTLDEQNRLVSWTFDDIWNTLWLNHNSKTYKNEYEYAKGKFDSLDIRTLIDLYPSMYTFQEFGFPKGRRNVKEDDRNCAIREFTEETGYKEYEYTLTNLTIIENFTGTDNVQYKHIYYIAKMKDGINPPKFDKTNKHQIEEIKNIGFFDKSQIKSLLRPYDSHKLKLVDDVIDIVKSL